MHEYQLAHRVLRTVEQAAGPGARVVVIRLVAGSGEPCSAQHLARHFAVIARGTALEAARLELRLTEPPGTPLRVASVEVEEGC